MPCPFARQYARAILSDVSAASEPEPQNNTLSRPAGVSSLILFASANEAGWPNWNAGA